MGMNDYMQLEGLGLRLIPVKSKSVRELSIYGSGRVAEDKVYKNVMDKWAFGGFDTEERFIDDSYGAEIQAMKIIMMRTAQEFLVKGQNEKAADMARKYFSAFPHMNFAYDDSVMPFIDALVATGNKEEAKEHLDILVNETVQRLDFYSSLDDDDLKSFSSDSQYAMRALRQIIDVLDDIGDPEYTAKVNNIIGPYNPTNRGS